MINLSSIEIMREPYPVGGATGVFDLEHYDLLRKHWPSESLFRELGDGYKKRSLSEVNNPAEYKQIVKGDWLWCGFHAYVKSALFIRNVFAVLTAKGASPVAGGTFKSRFEFSSMPADGGMIAPHTDIPSKVVTIVLPIVAPGGWPASKWSGATEILRPLDPTAKLVDYRAPWEEFEVCHSYPYVPNVAVVFVKTHNSWHGVKPIEGAPGFWRRTLTINIERAE